MKRAAALFTLFFLLIGILPLPAQAQLGQGIDIKPGVRAGVNFMTLGGQNISDNFNRRTGFIVGGFVLADAGFVAVQPELMYIQKGASIERQTFDGTTVTSTLKLNYIEVPFLIKLQAPLEEGITPNVFLGPTLGLNVAAEFETEGGGESATRDISANRAEFGLALGGGVDVDLDAGTLMIDARYEIGLTNATGSLDSINSDTNRGFVITAGFALDLSSAIQ